MVTLIKLKPTEKLPSYKNKKSLSSVLSLIFHSDRQQQLPNLLYSINATLLDWIMIFRLHWINLIITSLDCIYSSHAMTPLYRTRLYQHNWTLLHSTLPMHTTRLLSTLILHVPDHANFVTLFQTKC